MYYYYFTPGRTDVAEQKTELPGVEIGIERFVLLRRVLHLPTYVVW